MIWRKLWAPWRGASPLRTSDLVYIIAKKLPKGWDIVKVGETGTLEILLDRKVSGAGPHKGRYYRDLVIRDGYTLFWAPTRERMALQLLIARILLRVTTLTGHDRPRGVITSVRDPVDVRNVLPLELAGYALGSFGGHGTVTGRTGTQTTFVKYPKHPGDVLGAARHITLVQATDHAF
jgi:hypothetical protein